MRLKIGLKPSNLPFFWRFDRQIRVKRQQLLPRLEQELYAAFHQGFQAAYTALLQAFVTRDFAMLTEALDKKLSERVTSSLVRVQGQKQALEVVNSSAAVSLSLWNARIHVSPPPRHRPKTPFRELFRVYYNVSDSEDESQSSDSEEPRMRPSDLQIWAIERQKHALLAVDCLYSSCQKLLLRHESGQIARGNADMAIEQHWVRFETRFEAPDPKEVMEFFLYGEGESPIKEYVWTAVDVDFCLGGNPYAIRPFKLPFPI